MLDGWKKVNWHFFKLLSLQTLQISVYVVFSSIHIDSYRVKMEPGARKHDWLEHARTRGYTPLRGRIHVNAKANGPGK